jgi:hypothetical protein
MAGQVIRQETTGVTVERKDGKKVLKHFGGGNQGRYKDQIPKGFHAVVVPNERQDGVGYCVQDMLDMGYDLLTKDPKDVGTLGHSVMICPEEDYQERLRYIEQESDPNNAAMKFTPQEGAVQIGKNYSVGEPFALGGQEIVETKDDERVKDASGEVFEGTFDAPTD